MDSYYANQASPLPHFSGHYRKRGSGFWALASGIGRVALPLAPMFVLPVAKRIGKELLLQTVPELMDVINKKKSPKQALKNTISNTVKEQTNGFLALQMRRKSRMRKNIKRLRTGPKKTTKGKSNISRKRVPKRSRSDIFAKVKDDR